MKHTSLTLAALLLVPLNTLTATDAPRPNIVVIYTDDQGYGDMSTLNPKSKFQTPNLDRIAREGMIFTDGHCADTVCTPSRYALMTGRYAWRTSLKSGVLHAEGDCLIAKERMTVASMLKQNGYRTAMFGKWHLQMKFPGSVGKRDWSQPITDGPTEHGFDEFFGIPASMNYGVLTFIENQHVTDPPSLWTHRKQMKEHHTFRFMPPYDAERQGARDIEIAPSFRDDICLKVCAEKTVDYIPLNAAHAPLVVPKEYYQQYLGKPGVNEEIAKFFGMIENIDTNFGALLKQIDDWGIANNTLVIFLASDNGGTKGVHIFNAGMRGNKGRPYQGGTRVPCFFRWPAGGIPAGQECDALSSAIDLFPTLAAITGAKLSDEVKQQVEGRSLLPLLRDPKAEWPDRMLVHHVGRWDKGEMEEWKYKDCAIQNSRFTLVNNKELYDLKADPGESKNVIAEHPDVAAKLRTAYDQWWAEVQPLLVNETAVGPRMNPMKDLYWKQFGGGPDAAMLKRMNPNSLISGKKKASPEE